MHNWLFRLLHATNPYVRVLPTQYYCRAKTDTDGMEWNRGYRGNFLWTGETSMQLDVSSHQCWTAELGEMASRKRRRSFLVCDEPPWLFVRDWRGLYEYERS